jgi:hypothetical protein
MPISSLGKNPALGGGSAKRPSKPSLPTGLFSSRGIAPRRERFAIQSGNRDGELVTLCDGGHGDGVNGNPNGGMPLGNDADARGNVGAPQVFKGIGAPKENGQPVGALLKVGSPPGALGFDQSSGESGNWDIGASLCAGDKKGSPRGAFRLVGICFRLERVSKRCSRRQPLRHFGHEKAPARFPGRGEA